MGHNFRNLFRRNRDFITGNRSIFNFYNDDDIIDEALNHVEENEENREGEEEQDTNDPERSGANEFSNYRLNDPPFEGVDVLLNLVNILVYHILKDLSSLIV